MTVAAGLSWDRLRKEGIAHSCTTNQGPRGRRLTGGGHDERSPTESIRNVAVVSNTGSGKTSLVEALAYFAGSLPSLGSILAGTTASDFEPEEIHRRTSLNTSVLHCSYRDTWLNLLDTPGSPSFVGETRSALRVADSVILVVSASMGVRSEIQRLWTTIHDAGLPCVVFVNDLDKDGTDFPQTIDALVTELEIKAIPLTLPMGIGAQITDLADLLHNHVITRTPLVCIRRSRQCHPSGASGLIRPGVS